MDEPAGRGSGLWEAFIAVEGSPANTDEAREVLRAMGMSDEVEPLSARDGRYNIEIPDALRM